MNEENEKILYLLTFDKGKTLHENKQIFLSKSQKKLNEQPIGLGPVGGYDWQKPDAVKRSFEDLGISPHELLFWTGFAANFFGPYGRIYAVVADLANAKLYHDEGKNFEAGLMIAFTIIPTIKLLKAIPVVNKYGTKFFLKILAKSGELGAGALSRLEKDALKELMSPNTSKWMRKTVLSILFKRSLSSLFKKFSFPQLIRFGWLFGKKYPKTSVGLELAGTYYSFALLAKIFGLSDEPIKNPEEQKEILKLKKKLQDEFNKNPEKYQNDTTEEISKKFADLSDEEQQDEINRVTNNQ